VIDFPKAVRDPTHPDRMLPAYDGGDHLHPGDEGYKAMGEAVDLALFKQAQERDQGIARGLPPHFASMVRG